MEMARLKRRQLSTLPEPRAVPPKSAPEPASETSEHANDWRKQLRGAQAIDGTRAETYLRGRGIDLETAKASGALYAPKFYGWPAVVFPICDYDGYQIGANGRYFQPLPNGHTSMTAGKKSGGVFCAPLQFPNGRVLRPFDRDAPAVIVTEAPIDALSLAAIGFPAVAFCGCDAPSWIHLKCGLKRVVLAFDADDADDKAAKSLKARLAPFGARCERLRPESGKDWNEALQRGPVALHDFLTRVIYPEREFRVLDAYEPARAYTYAAKLFRTGAISKEQHDNLWQYALQGA